MTYVLRHALETLDEVRIVKAHQEWLQTAEAQEAVKAAAWNLDLVKKMNQQFTKANQRGLENVIKRFSNEVLYHLGQETQWRWSEFPLPVSHALPLYLREKMMWQMPLPSTMAQHVRLDSPVWMFEHARGRGWLDGQEPQLMVEFIRAGHVSDAEMLEWRGKGFITWVHIAGSKRMSEEMAGKVIASGDAGAVLMLMQVHPQVLSGEQLEMVRVQYLAPTPMSEADAKRAQRIAMEMRSVHPPLPTREAMLFSYDSVQTNAAVMAWYSWDDLCQMTDTTEYAHLRHDGWGVVPPASFAEHLVTHPDKWVRARVASLDDLSVEARVRLLLDRASEVRIRLASRADLTEDEFMVLAYDVSSQVRLTVRKNRHIPLMAYLLARVEKKDQVAFSLLRSRHGQKVMEDWLAEHLPTLVGFPPAMVDAAFHAGLKQVQELHRPAAMGLKARFRDGLTVSTR